MIHMELPIPKRVKKLWDAWHLRGCIILSLFLQAFLVSFASRRRQSKSTFLLFLIWSAYLLADWVAAVAIGAIIKSQSDTCDQPLKGENDDDLLSFWASFLLLHLGGPDSITSFALEDNEFWLRHLFGLALQGFAAAYSIFLTLPTTKLWLPAILVLVVGVVKYGERTYALYLASLDHFAANNKEQPETIPVQTTTSNIGYNGRDSKDLTSNDMELLQVAYKTFQIFKGPLLSRFYIFKPPPSLGSNHTSAFKLIEYELSIMYEVLHTKLVVVRRKFGYIFRFSGFCFIVSASTLFFLVEKKGLEKFDIGLTYALLIGAIVLDFISVVQLVCSDWTLGAFKGKWKSYIPSVIVNRKRWSGSVLQYNMIGYCLDERRMWLLYKFGGGNLNAWGNNLLDKMKIMFFSSSVKVPEDAKAYIFDDLKTKSDKAYNSDTAIFGSLLFRGHQTTWEYPQLKWSIEKFDYAERLLLWHLATELICFDSSNHSEDHHHDTKGKKRICKLLSDYMFYLLVMQPSMLSQVLGSNWKVGFQDTLADVKRFFAKNKITSHSTACKKIISVENKLRNIKSSDDHDDDANDHHDHVIRRSDDESKSVLFDACMLAKELRRMNHMDMWKAMDCMWVELMCYAAVNCRPIIHAQQLGKGGELLTLTWLLLNHLGLGFQFFL